MKRIITVLLALMMIVAVCAFAVSCNGNGNETTSTTTTAATTATAATTNTGATEATTSADTVATTTTTEAQTTTTEVVEEWTGKTKLPGYLDVDFGGKTFLIAARVGDSSGPEGWDNQYEIWIEALTNDAIKDSVYERNQLMKTLYNCTIMVDDGGWANGFNQDVAAGSGKYIAGCSAYQLSGTFANGNFYNVLNLDIDYTQSWWDQAFFNDVSCNGKLYGLCGDFAFKAMRASWIIIYNKDVYDNHFSDVDIYQLVRDHKWTLDKMTEMCQKVLNDGNGDQEYTYSTGADADTLGCLTTTHAPRGFFLGSGERYVSKDDSGKMVCALTSGKGSDVIDKIRGLTTDESYLTIGYTNAHEAMRNGTTLFIAEVMGTLEGLSDREDLRVGVLPQPLYDENQANYCNYVNNQATFYAVPTSYANMEEIADFFTLFAAHSQQIVRKAFINAYRYAYVSDEGSAEMIDLILNTRSYDPGYICSFATGFDSALPSMCSPTGKNQFAQAATRFSSAVNASIAGFEERIAAIDDPV